MNDIWLVKQEAKQCIGCPSASTQWLTHPCPSAGHAHKFQLVGKAGHAHQVDLARELQHVLQVVGSNIRCAEHLTLTVCGRRCAWGVGLAW